MQNESRHSGYTILELTVVVLIIALLLGAVLSGVSLLRDAQMRATITDLDTYQKALHMFYDKYNEMPGDMADATNFWPTDPGGCPASWNATPKITTCNGNGDGKISPRDFDNGSYSDFQESFRAWQHMNAAGFLATRVTGMAGPSGSGLDAQIGLNVPRGYSPDVGFTLYYLNCTGYKVDFTASTCSTSYFPAKYNHILEVGQRGTAPNDYTHAPYMGTSEALSIDTKIDDGKPSYGKLLVPITETSCITTTTQTTAAYDTSQTTSPLCSLIYVTGL